MKSRDYIKLLLKRSGLSMRALSLRAGLSEAHVFLLITGKRNADRYTATKLIKIGREYDMALTMGMLMDMVD